MTRSTYAAQETSHDMLAAIARAALAPSVHNTQPWLFHLTTSGIEVMKDASRQLNVLDPMGRESTLSCGAALLHLRIALRAAGYQPQVALFPEPGRAELLARVDVGAKGRPDIFAAGLDSCADRRQTNRRGYHGEVSIDDVEKLQAASEIEGAGLQLLDEDEDRTNAMVLQQVANTTQVSSPAYRRELRSWVSPERREDGVPLAATVEPRGAPHDLASRDFAFDQTGGLEEGSDESDTRLLVLFTEEDSPVSWVHAGEALARLWLEATRLHLVLQPLSQSVEDPGTRMLLRRGLRLMTCWPQLLLRVGRAPEQPRTGRRSVGDLTIIDSDVAGTNGLEP